MPDTVQAKVGTLYRKLDGTWVPQCDDFSGGYPSEDYADYVVGTNGSLFGPMGSLRISVNELCQIMLMFCNGGLWAVIGITISSLMESKYVAYASPFVIYYLLVILCERYIPEAYLLYPPNWTNPGVWPYGAWGAAIILLELSLVFCILFIIRAGRRLREL